MPGFLKNIRYDRPKRKKNDNIFLSFAYWKTFIKMGNPIEISDVLTRDSLRISIFSNLEIHFGISASNLISLVSPGEKFPDETLQKKSMNESLSNVNNIFSADQKFLHFSNRAKRYQRNFFNKHKNIVTVTLFSDVN